MLMKFRSSYLRLEELPGTAAIPGLVWNKKNPYQNTSREVPVAPSDHFGIVVAFSKEA